MKGEGERREEFEGEEVEAERRAGRKLLDMNQGGL